MRREYANELRRLSKDLACCDYVETTGGAVTRILCKCTGEPIREMQPSGERPFATEKIGNKIVERWAESLRCCSNFKQIHIAFTDGSYHTTPVSASAIPKLTPEKLRAMYLADLAQMDDGRLDVDSLAEKTLTGEFEVDPDV